LAIRAALRFLENPAAAMGARDAKVVIVGFGIVQVVIEIIPVVGVLVVFLSARPSRHRQLLSRMQSACSSGSPIVNLCALCGLAGASIASGRVDWPDQPTG